MKLSLQERDDLVLARAEADFQQLRQYLLEHQVPGAGRAEWATRTGPRKSLISVLVLGYL